LIAGFDEQDRAHRDDRHNDDRHDDDHRPTRSG
jgi:hypothetical protein